MVVFFEIRNKYRRKERIGSLVRYGFVLNLKVGD